MPIPAPLRATLPAPPRVPAGAGSAAATGALEPVRQMLERAWRLPAAPGAAKPPAGPGLLRGLGLMGAVAAGALLNSSGGELALLQLQGKVPLDIGLGQWQRAGAALERWNPHWKMPRAATPEQIGQAVRRAAELDRQWSSQRITAQQFRREMGLLARSLQAPSGPPAGALRPAATLPPPARPQPPHAARASQAVQQLGQAIRAHNARPGDPARRAALNDVFALARSLHANRHDWTPATQRNFDALAPQAVRALYGLPRLRSDVTHTRGAGAQTGALAAELEQRARTQRAQALETGVKIVHARSRTLLPGGSLEALARRVHADLGGAAALGMSADAFVARVRTTGPIQGEDATGRVRAGLSGSGGISAFGPRGPGPQDRERAIIQSINTLVHDTIRAKLSSRTPEGRARLVELLAHRDWNLTLQDRIVLPGASDRLPPMPVTIRLHRVDGGLHVYARLDPARDIEVLKASRADFARLGKPATAFFVDHTLPLKDGQVVLPVPGASGTVGLNLLNPWGAGGLPNGSGHFGLPPNFFDPRVDAGTFSRQIASAPGLHPSWVPSPVQHRQFMNLFVHRQALEALMNPPRPYPSHDAALGKLAETLRAMDRHPGTPRMFPVELSVHVFPANREGSQWGIGFGALGQDRSVQTFPTRLGAGFGERPTGPQSTILHTHPTHSPGTLSGFSLGDVTCVLSTGTSLAVYDNGVAMRIRLDDAWFALGAQTRRARVDALDALSHQFEALKARSDRLAQAWSDPVRHAIESRSIARECERLTREARRQLAELPIVFEVIGTVPDPQRTVAVGSFGVPLLPLSQARTR
jgi:hypothetical protein